MNINEVHDINLAPYEMDSYATALKNYVLFTQVDEEIVIAISKEYMSISLDFLSKTSYEYKTIFLDEISFEKLYNRFLEIKTDKEMSAIQQEQEDATLEDEDFSMTEFLKVGSDIFNIRRISTNYQVCKLTFLSSNQKEIIRYSYRNA